MVFVRPHRSATIRTRLDPDAIREQIEAFVRDSGPQGMERFLAHGWFLGGRVGARDFHLDYHYNAHKNPQTYAVRGTIQETPDWRIVRLRLRAHSPWMSGWGLALLVGVMGLFVAEGRATVTAALATLAIVVAVYALANLLYIPDVVTNRVSHVIASELRGSVLQGENWVVPRD